jgi:hypothetical protein
MRHLVGIWVALAVMAGLFAAAATPRASAAAKQCQAGFTESRAPVALVVSGDTCANGRKVALRVAGAAPSGCIKAGTSGRLSFRRPCTRLRYTCSAVSRSAGKSLRVLCSRGSRSIRFTY